MPLVSFLLFREGAKTGGYKPEDLLESPDFTCLRGKKVMRSLLGKVSLFFRGGDSMKKPFLVCLSFIIIPLFGVSHSEQFPKRIVSLSPNITEILYGLGAWESVVGVTLYSDFPPEVRNIPKIGGWVDPNLEAIVALKPDLVIMIEDQNRIFGNRIRDLGLKTLSLDCNNSIGDILDSIWSIGKALGKEREARRLIENVESSLEGVKAKVKGVRPRRVLFVVGRTPGALEDIYAIGKTGFINEIITIAGGENVIDSDRMAVKISKEAVLSLNPDVIVEVNHEDDDRRGEVLRVWGELKEVSAVKNGGVHIVSSTVLLHPSQRIVEGAGILAKIFHPEVFEVHGSGETRVGKSEHR